MMTAIAELEGIPAGTVASRLRCARGAFRELLERHPASVEYAGEQNSERQGGRR